MSYAFDPEIAPIVDYVPKLDLSDIPGTRAMLATMKESLPRYEASDGVTQESLTVPGDESRPAVELIVLRPSERAAEPAPLVVWFHGGGFVLGDASESLPYLDGVVRACGAVAVSVEYRLSPETRYPGGIDDGVAAVRWLLTQAETLGIDPQRIGIGGQSAGAAYAFGTVLKLRDAGGPEFTQLVLDVPVTDDRLDSPSARAYVDTPMWTRSNGEMSWPEYLGPGVSADGYAAPARAQDLSGLPPTFIAVNQYDPLRDEGLQFASRLAQAGVPTEAHLYPGTFHASASLAVEAAVSIRQTQDLTDAFTRAFAR